MSGNVKLALSHVVPDLVQKVLKGQDPLHILGEGDQVRHYTYGGDLAHGIRLAMESPAGGQRRLQPLDRRLDDRPRAGRDHLAQDPHGDGRPFHYVSDDPVRARRPAPRAGRAQGARRPRLRGDDHARPDARRGFFAEARARDLAHWWEGIPGGESFRHFYERVSSGVEGLLVGDHRVRVHEDGGHRIWQVPDSGRVLILAHEGTNAVLISHLLGVDPVPWAYVRFTSAHTGIHRLRTTPVARGAVWVLERFNSTEHLKGL
jgi:broad specificity phosphatase PhoE